MKRLMSGFGKGAQAGQIVPQNMGRFLEFRAFGLGHCRYGTVDVCALRIFQNAKQHLNRGT